MGEKDGIADHVVVKNEPEFIFLKEQQKSKGKNGRRDAKLGLMIMI